MQPHRVREGGRRARHPVAAVALGLAVLVAAACTRESTGPDFVRRYQLASINFQALPAPQGTGGRMVMAADFDFRDTIVVRSITFDFGGPFSDTARYVRDGTLVYMWYVAQPADTAIAQLEGPWLDWTVPGQRGPIHYRFRASR